MSVYKHYVIAQGETLQSIAQKLYGDMNRWRDLVDLNDLEYPYIVDTPQEKLNNPDHLLTRGDQLLLPNGEQDYRIANQNKVIESNTPHYQPDYYDNVMGMDIALNVSTDVPLREQMGIIESDHGRDLKRVVGLDNLKQSLINRILTRRGTLLMHPNYGSVLPDMLGKNLNSRMLTDVANELSRTIDTDSRVAKCKVDKALLSYDEIMLHVLVTPIDYDTSFSIYLYRSQEGQISIR